MHTHRTVRVGGRRRLPAAILLALLVAALTALPPAANAVPTGEVISSPGPLTRIYVSTELHCQVRRVGYGTRAFMPNAAGNPNPFDAACGTFVGVGGVVYGPTLPGAAFVPAPAPYRPDYQILVGSNYVQCIQTGVGFGTNNQGLVQTDCYRVGDTFYTTKIKVINKSSSSAVFTVYHFADCNRAGNTNGRGRKIVGGQTQIFCTRTGITAAAQSVAAGNAEGFAATNAFGALGPPADYIEGKPAPSWLTINGAAFPNTCLCWPTSGSPNGVHDNAMGLSGTFSVPASGSVTVYGKTML